MSFTRPHIIPVRYNSEGVGIPGSNNKYTSHDILDVYDRGYNGHEYGAYVEESIDNNSVEYDSEEEDEATEDLVLKECDYCHDPKDGRSRCEVCGYALCENCFDSGKGKILWSDNNLCGSCDPRSDDPYFPPDSDNEDEDEFDFDESDTDEEDTDIDCVEEDDDYKW